jgi:translation elongation factor EF-1beta
MGKTVLIYRINAKDMEQISETIDALKAVKKGEFRDAKRVPIAFGAEFIKAAFTVPEKDDKAVEELTKELNEIPLVEDAEMQEMTLL